LTSCRPRSGEQREDLAVPDLQIDGPHGMHVPVGLRQAADIHRKPAAVIAALRAVWIAAGWLARTPRRGNQPGLHLVWAQPPLSARQPVIVT